MRSRLFILLATLVLIPLSVGCNSLRISLNDANPPTFSFSAGSLAECCDHLAFLTVTELPSGDSKLSNGKVIWQVWPSSGTNNSAEALPPITYGQVPSGFVQKIPSVGVPPVLEEGKTYMAAGPLIEVPEAYVTFRIENGKTIKVAGP
jgi:hypothetical protein